MTFITKFYVVVILIFFIVTAAYSADSDNQKSIGFYTAGCIQNSQQLEETGLGYQVIRLSRERFYGHPSLIELIKYLGKHTKDRLNSTLLIGDM